ncbi:T9SS type A sorting domain-containing protein [Subsaxibacter sp. CAU 1640]|uniref:T9SS type A sorting domain-containing protein n=1 Tax=Subsaxibacter sp. CAU 1640 TaxID=2933271 RepID=UPI0020035225|nr:T9SS type A sorting domain-containing protein [Subsaxibacter sp. CAU 1640]MCK7590985.1 T9SS type A sorting domain-containing protein [Subsaxibacter sp. CAU 1640]
MKKITIGIFCLISLLSFDGFAQHTVARDWNEALLEAIRSDFSRPTVHARNLFHTSLVMYDAWAVFDSEAETVLLGKTFGGFNCPFNGITTPSDVDAARHEVLSYAVFRLLSHRFALSPGGQSTLNSFNDLLASYGYDKNFTSIDYSSGSYAALGNYLGAKMIEFGLQDNSNEQNGYANEYYIPSNEPMIMQSGFYADSYDLADPNRWQPLAFDTFVDQSGNVFPAATPPFLGPEWGDVTPFCLKNEDLEILNDGFDSYVYNNPGPPAYIQNSNEDGIDDPYKWYFSLVASWSSHLDPDNTTMIDISPGSQGNINFEDLPQTFEEYKLFYDFMEGGDPSTGRALNPVTNMPYVPNMIKRGDYARILAEFWADGPASETPPGHWFTILNYVSDHPLLEKRFGGQGPILNDLEWDVKSYLSLGGAMHDCAVDIWGIKGYYDYIRPVSAIRYMAWKGQSSDMSLPNYDPHGLPLIPGRIELIETGDPLSGDSDENVGKIKIFAWKGPDYISDPETDIAHVDWILGTKWWPYQRPTFVSPPFAGYLSGHSTFSRAAAENLSLITGSPYFPGGIGIFDAEQNEFLVFEEGPTQDIELQWATYTDASDQCSLSRIWGGIHPPTDDIKGRIIGHKIGIDAYNLALDYFNGTLSVVTPEENLSATKLFPVPFNNSLNISSNYNGLMTIHLTSIDGKEVLKKTVNKQVNTVSLNTETLPTGFYFVKLMDNNSNLISVKKVIKN